MITKSPSGALSPYYYKGGYFHGIHYGSYFHDENALIAMMKQEEDFILQSPEQRRIMIDLYETVLSPRVLDALIQHLSHISSKIIKLAIATDKKNLHAIKRAMKKDKVCHSLCCFYGTDMEEGKTWLVSDNRF